MSRERYTTLDMLFAQAVLLDPIFRVQVQRLAGIVMCCSSVGVAVGVAVSVAVCVEVCHCSVARSRPTARKWDPSHTENTHTATLTATQ